MRIYAGLRREHWERWGQFTEFKLGAADLLARELRPEYTVYCSPLVDPYQPEEANERAMPGILEAVAGRPPKRFVIQTRGPLILRDLDLLRTIPGLRVSFTLTTNREDVRRMFEPHCATFEERLETIRALRAAGIDVRATLAPLLPCDAEAFAEAALDCCVGDLCGDPLHVRAVKPRGATTREQAFRIIERQGFGEHLDPEFQESLVERIDAIARGRGRRFLTGPRGFALLSQ
jgi:DNA repair photolyase